jgi:hypothetical protein
MKLFQNVITPLIWRCRLFLVFSLVLIGIPVFAQDFSQRFQRTTGGNGYYRDLGDVGFVTVANVLIFNVNRYTAKDIYLSDMYPSVITGKVRTVFNVIDVPESLKTIMTNSLPEIAKKNPWHLVEFIFPYENKFDRGGKSGYLVIIDYGVETRPFFTCAQAFFLEME